MPAIIIVALCGIRVQQFVPWLTEMTAGESSAAICSAETISPRAAPA